MPAGGIISNAIDMGKYLRFHLNLGFVEDAKTQIIPKVNN
jgi:CubicO group peptidase (beta-lactamase class C family)